MAQRIQVLLVCDVHDDDTVGTETVAFSLDGSRYEIDVCDQHAAQLREAFAPYVAAARRSSGRSGGGRRGRRGRSTPGGFDPAAVRAWAKENGVQVSERGRISAEVLEQYAARK
jgi:hypothetical protein